VSAPSRGSGHPQLRAGVREDFDLLYRQSYTRVRYALQAMLRDPAAAEDCAQEAFVKALRAWHGWKGEAPAEAWLLRIAFNVAMSHRRRERLRGLGETVRRLGRPGHASGGEGGVELLDALRRLPPREAAAIVLRHHHGYSNREIAIALGIPESTVASRLAAAKRKLAAMLGEAGLSDPRTRRRRLPRDRSSVTSFPDGR
jgi:RNA polymerase sigma-70 factor (ECF subfamily)